MKFAMTPPEVSRPKPSLPYPIRSHSQSTVWRYCAKLRSWDPKTLFDDVVPNDATLASGQIHYKDFMRLAWFDPALIQEIDPRWNHYNMVREDTKLVHFSHVREQPWKRPEHPFTGFWERWLVDAMGAGYLRRTDVLKSVALGRIHPHFLRFAV